MTPGDQTNPSLPALAEQLEQRLRSLNAENARRASQAHASLLAQRNSAIADLAALVALSRGGLPQKSAPLFDRSMLDEFATGSVERCFGSDYAIYRGRRVPRIPNGGFLMMSRVMAIDGQRRQFDQPASIRCEYDVPRGAWFLRDNPSGTVPLSALMEIALQPCGFLTAYLGTQLQFPEQDFFFRNLDGTSRLLRQMDIESKTIQANARLLSTTASGGLIVQKFAFSLALMGEEFFSGETVFGFFTAAAMRSQLGLDGGASRPAWLDLPAKQGARVRTALPTAPGMPTGRLRLLDRIQVVLDSGSFGAGYALGEHDIRADDWFFSEHFYQDPVMPGSLGVEAVFQAVLAFARQTPEYRAMRNPHLLLSPGQPVQWKYRGQITPANRQMRVETHIRALTGTEDGNTIQADASVWADNLRIYEVEDLHLQLSDRSNP